MRISYWSSDVCSSDLLYSQFGGKVSSGTANGQVLDLPLVAVELIEQFLLALGQFFLPAVLQRFNVTVLASSLLGSLARNIFCLLALLGLGLLQIGRASCWESVCQYV